MDAQELQRYTYRYVTAGLRVRSWAVLTTATQYNKIQSDYCLIIMNPVLQLHYHQHPGVDATCFLFQMSQFNVTIFLAISWKIVALALCSFNNCDTRLLFFLVSVLPYEPVVVITYIS